ncbi:MULTISPECIES: LPS export ABC transporter periplasmic protein LptC [Roseobacteraceae]|jgi:lipopolysaccharide export system protein LptC|uniref:LptC_YrbK: LPS export ABC transporter periplasmic protein LptC n=1 Tax=Pseudosulfitobacter pseudonitzschiae TaxID=1402135 RepID=A0A221K4D2_9RHOB|nr:MULTISPECIES: LPS export ABC transporter periplasmic protein LptC [Roseobacteraceae]ASM73862.1 LptC_YrbK: LPS export ABC transporter periplasmic protein LptC [Pseudosulfitobacter pseudonitzschiae]
MDWYSKLVATLKVLLPLAALALLSTLFLLSRTVDPVSTIPFAEEEVQTRMKGQQITGPFFSGATEAGDSLSFAAGKLTTGADQRNEATDVTAKVDLAGGTRIDLVADTARLDLPASQMDLSGHVVITTSTGYTITSDVLKANLETATLTSPGQVQAASGIGDLTAGQMVLSSSRSNGPAQLIFTNGVKLVYDPKQTDE